jgi:ribosomal protein S18 acetylase RimI-like enzyme
MIVTAVTNTSQEIGGRLRPMDPTRDLGTIADLIAGAFAAEIDERGRAALREMRWMARLTPLVWWLARADPSFEDSFNGFVWEAAASRGRQIVGNASLNRAPGNRRWRIICNIVVQEEYQGHGIGRRLTEAAIAEARDLGSAGVLLQVYRDNPRALRLYTSLGFQEAAGETDFWLKANESVAFLGAPDYHLRPWKPADGEAILELAHLVTPQMLQWIHPLRADEYRPDWLLRLVQRLSNLASGQRVYRLTVLKEERLVAMMTVTAAFRQGEHRLALLIHPDHTGRVEAALISRALHMLAVIPSRPVRVTVDVEHTAIQKALREYGFEEQRTLLTLHQNFE